MIKALLLDLDGTLLDNDMDAFLQVYLKALSRNMAPWISRERLVPQLLGSTAVMLANRDPSRTLQKAFADDFYPALGTTEQAMHPHLLAFYQNEFPKLAYLTRRREAAARLIQSALDAGVKVAVATNPLFPRIAIDHRLEWAGIPSSRVPFWVATSYESFHSAKPKASYYAEILGHIGVHAAEAAMVGDNPLDDLQPARSLGMAVFHVAPAPASSLPGGSLEDVIEWYPNAEREADPNAEKRPDSVVARLHGQIGSLLSLLSDLSAETWNRRPAPESWSLTEILCHLRDIDAEVHRPRMEMILSSDYPFLPAIDTNPWASERRYADQSGPGALTALVEGRKRTLQLLESLPPEAWERRARHALLGPTTLAEVMSIAADHELLHLADVKLQAGGDGTSRSPSRMRRLTHR